MIRYIVKRIVSLIPILLAVSFVIFTLLQLTPGDPASIMAGTGAPKDAVEQLREEMGLNDPFLLRYFNYIKNFVTRFDLGTSYETKTPVTERILTAFPATLRLALVSILFAIIAGLPVGIISATKQYSFFDNAFMVIALIGISLPVFWSGMMLILLFSVHLKWLPSSGFTTFKHLILPGITLGAQSAAMIARMTRSSMLDVIRQDYIRTVRAKGLSEFMITFSHVLRNALIPIVTVIGLQFGQLIGGAVLTETIFSIPGIGRLLVQALKTRDYPVILGSVLFISVLFCLINLVIDIIYAFLDPKIKAQYARERGKKA
ncbi:MAG: ABC transporter permease [Oscillospiraceae bacterium]|nr:ABC transporter permease [Oscillospiraceae bacterium]